MIWVKGQIIAEGTEENVITFTRLYEEPNHCWGVIYVDEMAEISLFDHCFFNFSGFTGIALSNLNSATLTICNSRAKVSNCTFNNFDEAVRTKTPLQEFYFYKNFVDHSNFIIPFLVGQGILVYEPEEGYKPALIVDNYFKNVSNDRFADAHLVNNYFFNCNEHSFDSGYYFNNERKYCEFGLEVPGGGGSVYMKNNRFIGGYDGVNIEHAYVEFSDNYLENNKFRFYANNQSKVFNNHFNNSQIYMSGSNHGFYNNVIYNVDDFWEFAVGSLKDKFVNNIFYNNQTLFYSLNDTTFTNCIFINNNELYKRENDDRIETFINCIVDFPLGDSLLDGGGNIIVDSTQVEQIFVDLANEDFHLAPGSIAIDAGCDTIDYYYPFDMDYSHRIWDGDGDGNAVIDIGPYEYGSPSFGGIRGITYNPDSEEPINYVLLKINNILGEFTFSDSMGNFEYKLQEGVYNVYAERLYYDDVIMYEVEVTEGEFTEISIPMFATTEVEESGIIIPANDLKLRNYPNPFKPSGADRGPATTIEFLITEGNKISLSIYNIRGQLVKTLINSYLDSGKHQISWDGKNESGQSVSSGIYYCKLKSDKQESVRKMILIK